MVDHELVDSELSLEKLQQELERLLGDERVIYLDFEGVNLGRTGRLCLGQLIFPGSTTTYLLDFVALPTIMSHAAPGCTSLKAIFESSTWKKVFFDPRCDAAALSHQFNVRPRNVLCLQLSDIASRR
jgi:ribonuclease D